MAGAGVQRTGLERAARARPAGRHALVGHVRKRPDAAAGGRTSAPRRFRLMPERPNVAIYLRFRRGAARVHRSRQQAARFAAPRARRSSSRRLCGQRARSEGQCVRRTPRPPGALEPHGKTPADRSEPVRRYWQRIREGDPVPCSCPCCRFREALTKKISVPLLPAQPNRQSPLCRLRAGAAAARPLPEGDRRFGINRSRPALRWPLLPRRSG